jgi:hypothetical protein
MASVAPASQARESHKALVSIAALLIAAMTWFVAHKAHYLTDYSLASYTECFWPRRIGLVVHLVGGMLALVTGLTQIWLGLTRRTSSLHRLLGKAYASSILVASCGGFYLGFTISGPPAYRTGLIFLNVVPRRRRGGL